MTWNSKPSSLWQRLLVALVIVAAASAFRVAFFGELGRGIPYLLYYPAVMLAALYGGLPAGLLATVISAALCFFWIQRGFMSPTESLALAVFVGSCLFVSFIGDAMRRARTKAEAANQQLRREMAEHKRSEERLREVNGYLDKLFNYANAPIIVWDPQFKITRFNHAFESLTGRRADEVIGKSLELLFPPAEKAHGMALIKTTTGGERWETVEIPILHLDGAVRTLLWNSATIFAPDDKSPVATIAQGHDITVRKILEEDHARLVMAVEQAAETIIITDPDGTIFYANPAFEKTSGYTSTEALGQNSRILKSGKQDAAFYCQMWGALRRGEIWKGHFINRRKDGTLYEEEAVISPMRDATNQIINFVAVKRDVTREVKLEAQFRQAQKMEAIGQLAGGVAHDFNNILSVIHMQMDLLKYDSNLSAEQLESLEEVRVVIQRAVALTRQLLMFSRREVMQPRDLDLNHSVAEMTKMLTRLLGENIAVKLKLAAQPMSLHADAGMMDQVLMNLAVNARDAMSQGGQLVIETAGVEFDEFAATQTAQARPGSFVRLSVRDNGCGIPPENLSKIFEPFFTTKGVGKGTGLGLATVFGIAQQHHGWVNVHSVVGHGTTFDVYLPRLSESHDTKIIKKLPAAALTGRETILLVEDEPVLRTMVGKSLSRLGYRVLEASTGFKALEVWKEHSTEIHLLLTDLMMPDGMNGKELGQRLLQENPKLRVIYMSGYSADIVANDFPLQEGVNFLIKPFQSQKLAETIRERLDKPG